MGSVGKGFVDVAAAARTNEEPALDDRIRDRIEIVAAAARTNEEPALDDRIRDRISPSCRLSVSKSTNSTDFLID
jgi:hypothetical protein